MIFRRRPFFRRYLFRPRHTGDTDAFHNHLVPVLQTRRNNPIRTLLLRDRYLAGFHTALGIHNHHGIFRTARYRLLWNDECIIRRHLIHQHTHIQAGHQDILIVRYGGAQGNLTGRFVNGRISKQQAAFFRINRTVVKFDADRNRTIRRQQLAFGYLPAQFHHFGCRLGNVHIHRIGLADGG